MTDATTLVIRGGQPVYGHVRVSGFKHVLVLALAYLIGARKTGRISNVPNILETGVYQALLPQLGVPTEYHGGILHIDATRRLRTDLPAAAQDIHGSLYLLPALLANRGLVRFTEFGGCRIGPATRGKRPWHHVVRVLQRFGAQFDEDCGWLRLHADQLHACEIDLRDFTEDPVRLSGPQYSGATKAAILAAALTDGTTVLHHPYLKTEVLALLDLLQADGIRVSREAASLRIDGRAGGSGSSLLRFTLPPDLLEVVTWVTIAATTGGAITMHGVTPQYVSAGLASESRLWRAAGIAVTPLSDALTASSPSNGFAELPRIEVHPSSIYSDSQPLFAVLGTCCPGETQITDFVWSNRYSYIDALALLGARTRKRVDGVSIGHGQLVAPYHGVQLTASDLRCAAALATAALASRGGPVTIRNAHHLRRGYDDLIGKLAACQAQAALVPAS